MWKECSGVRAGENSRSKGPEAAGLSLNRQRPHCKQGSITFLCKQQAKHPCNILLYACLDSKTKAAQADAFYIFIIIVPIFFSD